MPHTLAWMLRAESLVQSVLTRTCKTGLAASSRGNAGIAGIEGAATLSTHNTYNKTSGDRRRDPSSSTESSSTESGAGGAVRAGRGGRGGDAALLPLLAHQLVRTHTHHPAPLEHRIPDRSRRDLRLSLRLPLPLPSSPIPYSFPAPSASAFLAHDRPLEPIHPSSSVSNGTQVMDSGGRSDGGVWKQGGVGGGHAGSRSHMGYSGCQEGATEGWLVGVEGTLVPHFPAQWAAFPATLDSHTDDLSNASYVSSFSSKGPDGVEAFDAAGVEGEKVDVRERVCIVVCAV